jgi:aminoglycoside phosphotransferase (APT) family kinase protein
VSSEPATIERQRTELEARVSALASARQGEELAARLALLEGGHSGLTWRGVLSAADGERPLVVKSVPPGRPPRGRHDVLRQARIMAALGGSAVRVPEILFASEEEPQFFAMEMVAGDSAEPVLDGGAEGEGAAELARAWREIVGQLVALGAAELGALTAAPEPALSGGEELERWEATMRAAGLDADPRARRLAAALAAAVPAAVPATIVHGDFRLGNTLRRDGRVGAVIDWEIWGRGDPRTDLAWLCIFAEPAQLRPLGRELAGVPAPAALLVAYAEQGGSVADFEWFAALARFKLASIQAHNIERHRSGRRHDPYLEAWEPVVPRLLERGLELLAKD